MGQTAPLGRRHAIYTYDPPRPTSHDLAVLGHLFKTLQSARSVEALNAWRDQLIMTTSTWLLAYRRSEAERERADIEGLIPLWSVPQGSRVELDTRQDFVIRLPNGMRAHWDFTTQRWNPVSLWQYLRYELASALQSAANLCRPYPASRTHHLFFES